MAARVSTNNGLSFYEGYEIACIDFRFWNQLVENMDDNIVRQVNMELAPCSELEFLARYLELANEDLIIG